MRIRKSALIVMIIVPLNLHHQRMHHHTCERYEVRARRRREQDQYGCVKSCR